MSCIGLSIPKVSSSQNAMIPCSQKCPILKIILTNFILNCISFLPSVSHARNQTGDCGIILYIIIIIYVSAGPCRLPDVAAGFIVAPLGAGLTVPHGSALQYDCDEGFQPQNSTTTCCHNGTWLTIPVCVPG